MEYGVILFDSISTQPQTGAGVAKACIEKNQRSLNTFRISGGDGRAGFFFTNGHLTVILLSNERYGNNAVLVRR